MAEEVVGEMAEARLQSDARFVEALVRSRLTRGYGPVRVREELRQRGVDEALAREWLTDRSMWREALERARTKRFGATPPDSPTERARQARFLQQRGFELDAIRACLREDA